MKRTKRGLFSRNRFALFHSSGRPFIRLHCLVISYHVSNLIWRRFSHGGCVGRADGAGSDQFNSIELIASIGAGMSRGIEWVANKTEQSTIICSARPFAYCSLHRQSNALTSRPEASESCSATEQASSIIRWANRKCGKQTSERASKKLHSIQFVLLFDSN